MNTKLLYEILAECTVQLRKGPQISGKQLPGVDVVEIYMMPDESEAPDDMFKLDVFFLVVGVDLEKAEARKTELLDVLSSYPNPERLAGGPSYIEVGAEIGDQSAAFQLFAIGKALGLWDVITPETFGFSGEKARAMAGQGFVMMTGHNIAA
jgi:hypothetical protein